jgi:HAD superfamily hydrolase (TIGR01490 family)
VRKAAFFDVDGVIYKGIMGIEFLEFLSSENLLAKEHSRELQEIKQAKDRLTPMEFYRHSLDLWIQSIKDKKKREVSAEAERFAEKEKKKVSKRAIEEIARDRKNGYMIILITGSPIEVVQPLKKSLKADLAIGAEVIQQDGKYTGAVRQPLPIGEGKADFVRNIAQEFGIDLAESKAYGNSKGDLPMLELVGRPVVINPIGELKEIAKQNSWKPHHWK